jgi:hypothetical protein
MKIFINRTIFKNFQYLINLTNMYVINIDNKYKN